MSRNRSVSWAARVLTLAGLCIAVLGPASLAAAQNYPASTTVTTDPCSNANAASTQCGTRPSIQVKGESTLPFTGGDVALVAVLGAGAAGAGTILVLAGRRSRTAA
jgi:hypothetical protein